MNYFGMTNKYLYICPFIYLAKMKDDKTVAASILGLDLGKSDEMESRHIAALAGLALYMDEKASLDNINEAASIGLSLYLEQMSSSQKSDFSVNEIAAVVLAYHLALEYKRTERQANPMQTTRRFSPWAYKGLQIMGQMYPGIPRKHSRLR